MNNIKGKIHLSCSLKINWLLKLQKECNQVIPAFLYCDHEHKTSHKCQFYTIEIYASSESWIMIFPLMYGLLWFGRDTNIKKSGIWGCKKI